MADDNQITIELDLDTGQFTTKLGDATTQIRNFGQSAKGGGESGAMGIIALNQALELMEKGLEVVEAGWEKVSEAIGKSAQHEELVHGLNLALANSGIYTQELSQHMQEYADQLERTSSFSEESILQAEKMASNFAYTSEQAQKLTKAAVDLSAATGVSLDTAVQRLGVSLQGFSGHLERLAPGIGKLTKQQLEAGAAIDYVAARYAGSAAMTVDTFAGRVVRLHNAWDQLYQKFGDAITQSPVINKAIETISEMVFKLSEIIGKFSKSGMFDNLLLSVVDFGATIMKAILTPFQLAHNIAQTFFSMLIFNFETLKVAIVEVGNLIVQSIVGKMVHTLSMISNLIAPFSEGIATKIRDSLVKPLEGVQDASSRITSNSVDMWKAAASNVAASAKGMFDFPINEKIDSYVKSLHTFASEAEKTQQTVINKSKKMHNDYAEIFYKGFVNGLVKITSFGLSTLGAALVKGGSAFDNFGKKILGIIGQMSISIGENILMQGLAIEALRTALMSLNGAAAIAAGLALIVLGGALQAMSGGESGGLMGGAPAADTGGGSGAGGGVSPASQQQMQDEKKAQIVINGDFLNSRETANHLSEILRSNSDITNYAIVAQGKNY